MEFKAVVSEGESPFAEPRTPRLGIFHLFLWTLCSATYLALHRLVYTRSPYEGDALLLASGFVYGITMGAVLAGAIILGYMRVRSGSAVLRYPGHWLLMVTAILYSAMLAITLPQALRPNEWQVSSITAIGVIQMLSVVAYILAALHQLARRWKLLFYAMAGMSAATSLFYAGLAFQVPWLWLLSAATTWGSLFLAGWVAVASVLDFVVAGEQQDWLHWTGVATYVANAGCTAAIMIGQWILPH